MTSIPAFETINCPFTKISYNLSHSSKLCSAIDFEILIPALFTTISTPPKAKQVASNAFAVLFSSVTFNSALETASLPNILVKSAVAPSKRSSFISLITTQAPSSAKRFAIAFPIPPAEPVIKATRPDNDFGFGIRCNLASSNNQYSISKAS